MIGTNHVVSGVCHTVSWFSISLQKFLNSFKPTAEWMPASQEHAKSYDVMEGELNGSIAHKVKQNIFGS